MKKTILPKMLLTLLAVSLLTYAISVRSVKCFKAGDVNKDGVVDVFDFVIIGFDFGKTVPPGDPTADLNSDGFIDILDLAIVAADFGS